MKTVMWAVLAAVLAGAVGFYGGVTYQKAQSPSGFARQGGGTGQGGFGGGQGGGSGTAGGQRGQGGPGGAGRFPAGGIATGTVMAQDATSITVKLATGGSKTVYVDANTRVGQQTELKVTDVKVGDTVAAMGQPSNGGIQARSITIVPPGQQIRGGGFGGF